MRRLESFVIYLGIGNALLQLEGIVPAAAGVVLLAHLFLERPRYQFALVYGLLGYTLYLDTSSFLNETPYFRPLWFIAISIVVLIGSSAIACLTPVVKFTDELRGKYKLVGCTTSHLKGVSGDGKKLSFMARVFYPTESVKGCQEAPYFPNGVLTAKGFANKFSLKPSFIFSHLALSKSNCFIDAPLARGQEKLPVVVYSHGNGANADYALTIVRHLVSNGYFVVCVEHNDKSACVTKLADGTVVEYKPLPKGAADNIEHQYGFRNNQLKIRVRECRYVFDTLNEWNNKGQQKQKLAIDVVDKLDLDRIAMMGHSFGGATAVQVCFEDDRPSVCINHDGWQLPLPKESISSGINNCPLMIIESEQWLRWKTNFESLEKMFRASHDDSVFLTLKGTRHQNFADVAIWSPFVMKKVRAIGTLNPKEGLKLINDYTLAFLNQYNVSDGVGEVESLLSGDSEKMPKEVMWHHK